MSLFHEYEQQLQEIYQVLVIVINPDFQKPDWIRIKKKLEKSLFLKKMTVVFFSYENILFILIENIERIFGL